MKHQDNFEGKLHKSFIRARFNTRITCVLLCMTLFIFLSACDNNNKGPSKLVSKVEIEKEELKEGYDTKVLGVIKEVNMISSTITYSNIDYGTDYTLVFNGGADILDKYENVLSISQIKVGEIVDLYYSSETNKLAKLQISKDAWEYKGVSNLVIAKTDKIMSIVDQKYKYTNELVIANGVDLISLIDINNKDELTIKGREGNIYSIIVEKGHGYIRFANYENFIDGTVEVGYNIILPIVKDMLIIAREGNYKVTLEKDTLRGSKKINVIRDKEVIVDMADFRIEPVQVSNVEFQITPTGADLYIDNKLTDYENAVVLKFGEYKIEVKLGGYTTYTGILTTDIVSMDVNIDLVEKVVDTVEDKTSSESENNSDDNEEDSNTSTLPVNDVLTDSNSNNTNKNDQEENEDIDTNITDNNSIIEIDKDHKITILKPVGAEVYLNGLLKGTSPISFEKEIGMHTISLRQDGYIARSYTVGVTDDLEDVSFSFPDMKTSN